MGRCLMFVSLLLVLYEVHLVESWPGRSCDFVSPGRQTTPGLPRIFAAPDSLGIAIVWQHDYSVFLQRFSRYCGNTTSEITVFNSTDFWREPAASGLVAAEGLSSNTTAVAWVLECDVWLRVVDHGKLGNAVRASEDGDCDQTQVSLTASPTGTFVASWTSQCRGGGWCLFVRQFSRTGQVLHALSNVTQVNEDRRGVPLWPQFTYCGSQLWSLWLNGTERSRNGPLVRKLTFKSTEIGWQFGMVHVVHSTKVISATFLCSFGARGSGALWYESGPNPLFMAVSNQEEIELVDSGVELASPVEYSALAALPSSGSMPGSLVGSNFEELDWGAQRATPESVGFSNPDSFMPVVTFIPAVHKDHMPRVSQQEIQPSSVDRAVNHSSNQLQEAPAFGLVVMLALTAANLLITVENSASGSLTEQGARLSSRSLKYPKRTLEDNARLTQARWDTVLGSRPALLVCFATDQSLRCISRDVPWLEAHTGLDNNFGWSTILMMLVFCVFLMMVCYLRRCEPARQQLQARRAREASQALINELRQQVNEIPLEPLSSRPRESNGMDGIEITNSGRTASTCAICLNDLVVRVALQPCGHTACRECVLRIIDMNQRCHICRSVIEGCLPVYM